MALKTFKPYTKSTRTTVLVDRKIFGKVLLLKNSHEERYLLEEEIT